MDALEILVNGQRVAIVGANFSVHVGVHWTKFITGGYGFDAGAFNDRNTIENAVTWPMPAIGIGDEVTIRPISAEAVDKSLPRVSKPYPKPPTPPRQAPPDGRPPG